MKARCTECEQERPLRAGGLCAECWGAARADSYQRPRAVRPMTPIESHVREASQPKKRGRRPKTIGTDNEIAYRHWCPVCERGGWVTTNFVRDGVTVSYICVAPSHPGSPYLKPDALVRA